MVADVGSCNYICFCKCKGLSEENISAPTTSGYSLNPQLSYLGYITRVELTESCSNEDRTTYDHEKIVNIYIVHEINKNVNNSSHATQENCLFGIVSLTKNLDIDKNKCSRYGIGFDRHGFFHSLGVELVEIS